MFSKTYFIGLIWVMEDSIDSLVVFYDHTFKTDHRQFPSEPLKLDHIIRYLLLGHLLDWYSLFI